MRSGFDPWWPVMLAGWIFFAYRFLRPIWKTDPELTEKILDGLVSTGTPEESARALLRAFPALSIGFGILILAGNVRALLTWAIGDLHRGPVAVIALIVAGIGFLFLYLLFPIASYNRPRWIVPPGMRGQPGTRDLRR